MKLTRGLWCGVCGPSKPVNHTLTALGMTQKPGQTSNWTRVMATNNSTFLSMTLFLTMWFFLWSNVGMEDKATYVCRICGKHLFLAKIVLKIMLAVTQGDYCQQWNNLSSTSSVIDFNQFARQCSRSGPRNGYVSHCFIRAKDGTVVLSKYITGFAACVSFSYMAFQRLLWSLKWRYIMHRNNRSDKRKNHNYLQYTSSI